MKTLLWPVLILAVWMGTPSARADFLWLGDWEVRELTGDASFFARSVSNGGSVDLYSSASFPDGRSSSSIRLSRSFEVANAPAGLPITLSWEWDATVDFLPRTHGQASAGISIAGMAVDYSADPYAYDPDQGFFSYDLRDLLLEEGIYTLDAYVRAGLDLGPGANFPGGSNSSLRIELTAVPEPTAFGLLTSAFVLIGGWRWCRR